MHVVKNRHLIHLYGTDEILKHRSDNWRGNGRILMPRKTGNDLLTLPTGSPLGFERSARGELEPPVFPRCFPEKRSGEPVDRVMTCWVHKSRGRVNVRGFPSGILYLGAILDVGKARRSDGPVGPWPLQANKTKQTETKKNKQTDQISGFPLIPRLRRTEGLCETLYLGFWSSNLHEFKRRETMTVRRLVFNPRLG